MSVLKKELKDWAVTKLLGRVCVVSGIINITCGIVGVLMTSIYNFVIKGNLSVGLWGAGAYLLSAIYLVSGMSLLILGLMSVKTWEN